jgi:hypothetical protein
MKTLKLLLDATMASLFLGSPVATWFTPIGSSAWYAVLVLVAVGLFCLGRRVQAQENPVRTRILPTRPSTRSPAPRLAAGTAH